MSQLPLFDLPTSDARFRHQVQAHDFRLEEVDIGDITFQSGQREPVHRWYRLTPSYAPSLVRFFLREFSVGSGDLVLDPFAGRGTTTIDPQRRGIPSLGVEVNPLLHLVGHHSLQWEPAVSPLLDDYLDALTRALDRNRVRTAEEIANAAGTRIPNIHDVYRWWRPAVLRDLLTARSEMERDPYEEVRHFLWLAVNKAALDCANIHRNHPTITFDDHHDRTLDVPAEIAANLRAIRADLAALTPAERAASGSGRVVSGDSCGALDAALDGALPVTCVVTSPPYPNRFSYVHQTRPQLHFMEVISERHEATAIDLQTVGGTWGRATSDLMKAPIEPPEELREVLTYSDALRDRSTLMYNYVTKYFVNLQRHIRALRRLVAPGRFRGAYVVGNSRLSDIEIYTETILGRLFELEGFEVERIVLFRKRGGRKRLYETAVCVRA